MGGLCGKALWGSLAAKPVFVVCVGGVGAEDKHFQLGLLAPLGSTDGHALSPAEVTMYYSVFPKKQEARVARVYCKY